MRKQWFSSDGEIFGQPHLKLGWHMLAATWLPGMQLMEYLNMIFGRHANAYSGYEAMLSELYSHCNNKVVMLISKVVDCLTVLTVQVI